MSNRITISNLNHQVETINTMTESPATSWSKDKATGRLWANIGNYHLDWAYGGVRLVRMSNQGGGINVISTVGFGTKRELYNWLRAFIDGMLVSN